DGVVVGDGLAGGATMGPLNNKTQFEFVTGLLERSRKAGLTVITRGRQLDPAKWHEGFFMLPSIVTGAEDDEEIVRCEQFGPVIPIMSFRDEEEALVRANNTQYGLRASVWTRSKERAQELADRLE